MIDTKGAAVRVWGMLGLLLAAQVAVALVGRSLGPLAPLIQSDLSLSKAQVGMFPAALFLGQALVSLPSGFLADRFGSRLLLLLLCLWLGGSFALFALSGSFALALLFIVLGGFGYGAMHPATGRGILYLFSATRRGTAMGIKQMGITAGSALAALALLPLAIAGGWRPAVLGASGVLIATGAVAFLLYRNPAESAARPDKTRSREFLPAIRELARNRLLWLISLGALGLNGAQMALSVYLIFFAYEYLGFSLPAAGLLLVVSEVSGSLGRVGWGVVSDNLFGGRRIIVLQIAAVVAGLCAVALATVPANVSPLLVVAVIALFGFTVTGFNGVWMNAASEAAPREISGLATGLTVSVGSVGVMVVPPFYGYLVDTTGTYTWAWLTLGALMVLVVGILSRAGASTR